MSFLGQLVTGGLSGRSFQLLCCHVHGEVRASSAGDTYVYASLCLLQVKRVSTSRTTWWMKGSTSPPKETIHAWAVPAIEGKQKCVWPPSASGPRAASSTAKIPRSAASSCAWTQVRLMMGHESASLFRARSYMACCFLCGRDLWELMAHDITAMAAFAHRAISQALIGNYSSEHVCLTQSSLL